MTAQVHASGTEALARQLPPITQLQVGALALAIIGGIDMASYFPRRPPLGLPITLLAGSAAVFAIAGVMLARVRDFAWDTFFLVLRWALLAYLIQAAMIEYVFVHNHASGAPLVVVTLMLVMFAITIPNVIAFAVARYQVVPRSESQT
jgi:drug/metabolite transporter (DMT)-like permease